MALVEQIRKFIDDVTWLSLIVETPHDILGKASNNAFSILSPF